MAIISTISDDNKYTVNEKFPVEHWAIYRFLFTYKMHSWEKNFEYVHRIGQWCQRKPHNKQSSHQPLQWIIFIRFYYLFAAFFFDIFHHN